MQVQLKSMCCQDLEHGKLPSAPGNCSLLFEAHIGPAGSEGADLFYFTVITAEYLAQNPETRWGSGLLLVESFSWQVVERMLERLISGISANSWPEAAQKLSKFISWEFENYQRQNR